VREGTAVPLGLRADLAMLSGVSTKRLNEQVRRNLSRLPEDFAFRLTHDEVSRLRSHIATSKTGRGGRLGSHGMTNLGEGGRSIWGAVVRISLTAAGA